MKVSHESPLSLLEMSRDYNDYDYALVHLFESIPEYYQFFVDSLKQGREVILDNSIFELGESYDPDKFAEWIKKLQPTYYIIPDCLNNYQKTIDNLNNFINKYPNLPGKRIGVVQGRTYEDICYCYNEMDKYCDKIAISFDYDLYLEMIPEEGMNIWQRWCLGRQKLIEMLVNDNIINVNKKHHLLGIALPQELKSYYKYNWIDSVDTSNPIVHGLYNIKYNNGELSEKKSTKLVDLIHTEVNNEQLKCIKHNIKQFKNNMNKVENTLGKKVTYKDQYDPSILFPINREERRKGYVKMYGKDVWTCFEVSYLLPNGLPQFMVLRITNPADSVNIFESKSLKLYLNSFNNTVFNSEKDVLVTIKKDLDQLTGGDCKVEKITEFKELYEEVEYVENIIGDSININEYNYNPGLLEVECISSNENNFDYVLKSNLLRSNCEITNQPDWGTITVHIKSKKLLSKSSFLKYIVSYRRHQEFHEPTCERIFQDLYKLLEPEYLTVLCQYTRRGGIDINPFRSLTKEYEEPIFNKTIHQ